MTILIRLPAGGQISRRFRSSMALTHVFDFAEASKADELDLDTNNYVLEMNYPKRTFTRTDAGASATTIHDAGLSGRREALFLRRTDDSGTGADADAMAVDTPSPTDGTAKTDAATANAEDALSRSNKIRSEWAAAMEHQTYKLDRQLSEEDRSMTSGQGQDAESHDASTGEGITSEQRVHVFQQLVASGVENQRAAAATQKYGKQLRELITMGFTDLEANLAALARYDGRMLRVVNALSERPSGVDSSRSTPEAMANDTDPGPIAHQMPPPQQPTLPADPQAAFQQRLAQLIAEGVPPNEAAVQAIAFMQEQQQQPTILDSAKPPMPTSTSAGSGTGNDHGKWRSELGELASMGFNDAARNVQLLERYQGRMVRVINALAGGD